MTGFDIDGVGLTLVLRDRRVNAVDDVRSNGGLEDGGKGESVARGRRAAGGEDVDLRTGRLHQKC
jgi:hypothetical protein